MKLTKLQRHTAYCIMLAEFTRKKLMYEATDGFCWFSFLILGLTDKYDGYNNLINEYFPELLKRKPKEIKSSGLWFEPNKIKSGLNKRIKILMECIEETY